MPKTKKPRKDRHVVLEPGVGYVCQHCGKVHEIKFPISIPMFAAIAKQFVREHANCKPKAAKP